VSVHPTAIVHPGARIAADAEIGAYSVIDEHVSIGADTRVGHHCVIAGQTRIGRGNRISSFVSLGGPPQDKKYGGEPTALEIGDNNTIREFCTLNTGTAQDVGTTRLGNGNWIMAYVHLAHDCQVGNETIFANNAQLAGHVHVGDFAILGGFTVVHQFVKIGAHSITAMGTILLQDLPPYVMASGNPAAAHGVNSEGLRRRGFSAQTIDALRRAYKTLYRSGLTLEEAKRLLALSAEGHVEIRHLLEFLASVTRGIVR
jgi:UDP-N-acetylglucosamine acyltransferase